MAGPCACRWVFTLNKYMDEDCSCLLEELNAKKCHFAVVGKEVGEGGTPHLQGFAYFKQKVRFNSVKKRFGLATHVQVATSSDSVNDRYCSKGNDLLLAAGWRAWWRSCKETSSLHVGECDCSESSRHSWLDALRCGEVWPWEVQQCVRFLRPADTTGI